MSFWTLDSLRAACGASVIGRPEDFESTGARPEGVSIDSRTIKPGEVFVAIAGDRFDGHDFLPQAVKAGASVLVIQRREALPAEGLKRTAVLLVPDTRRALLRLAGAYRRALESTRVIAVCGSNGKTTTTRLIHAMLSVRLRGQCSEKSFNNDVGVPLTILSSREGDQFLICEVGSNAPGEIARLGAIVQPDIAVITSIGREHLEGFGSLEGVAREEAAILAHVRDGGAAVVPADTPLLDDGVKAFVARGGTAIRFGRTERADLRLTGFEHIANRAGSVPDCLRMEINSRWSYTAPLVGEHNALNAIAAIATARRLGLSESVIAAGLPGAVLPGMRMETGTVGGITVVNDAYNANPDSTLAALRTFASLHAGAPRRVVVLGDNLELGTSAQASHEEIGRAIAVLGCIDVLISVGPLARVAAQACAAAGGPEGVALSDLDAQQAAAAASHLRPGDAVLLKGSRRMALERIVAALKAAGTSVRGPSHQSPART